MANGSHRLRKGRAANENQAYFITTTVHERRPLLENPPAAVVVLDALGWLEKAERITLHAAVVMPDHLHFVAVLNGGTLPELMHSLKGYTGKRLNSMLGRQGRLWQDQYYDHAVRKDEVLNEVVLYMLHNPVRAGLVTDFHEYPFWYCRWQV